jgi:hypothetical protein
VLLAEVCLLKDRGLTTEAVVTDFIFKNIQSLKDRAYPAYLYSGVNDSTRVTNRIIPTEDLMSRLDMILRGRDSNAGSPMAYSAWNMPPRRPFSEFVSNPPARDGSLGLRVRPSSEDIEALIAPLWSHLEDEKQTHFDMSVSHLALRNKARCISYMRQEDNIYNNKAYRDKCHNNIRVFIT